MDILTDYDAIETALEALHICAAETDTASPEGSKFRAAIETLEIMRDKVVAGNSSCAPAIA